MSLFVGMSLVKNCWSVKKSTEVRLEGKLDVDVLLESLLVERSE